MGTHSAELILQDPSDKPFIFDVASISTVVGPSTGVVDGPLIKVPPMVTRILLKGLAGFLGGRRGIAVKSWALGAHQAPRVAAHAHPFHRRQTSRPAVQKTD